MPTHAFSRQTKTTPEAATVHCVCGESFTGHRGSGPSQSASFMADLALDRHIRRALAAMRNPETVPVDRAGLAVRSSLDGTIGVTCSGVGSRGYIDVAFIGSIGPTPFPVHLLTATALTESN